MLRKDIINELEHAREAIEEGLSHLEKAKRLAKQSGDDRLAAEIEGYTIGNIVAFVSYKSEHKDHQMGNIPKMVEDKE